MPYRLSVAILLSAAALAQPGNDSLKDILIRGWNLKPERIAELESGLKTNPEDIEGRAVLVSNYFQNMKSEDLKRHVVWLVKNHPESPLLGSSARLCKIDGLGAPAGDWQEVAAIWRDVLRSRGSDVRVLSNAAWFFEPQDLDAAESLRLKIRQLAPGDEENERQLQMLYMRVISASLIRYPQGVQNPYANADAAARFETELLASTDARSLRTIAQRLDPKDHVRGNIDASQLEAFVSKLRDRADEIDPGKKLMPEAPRAMPARVPARSVAEVASDGRIFVPYTEQDKRLLKRVDPVYPEVAKQRGIHGTVGVSIVIGTDGRVKEVGDALGPELLVPAAREAVRQWVYEMTLIDNTPREIRTTAQVEFKLPER